MERRWTDERVESLRNDYQNDNWSLLGYESFEQYCESQHGISVSYALNLIVNGRYLKEPIPVHLRWTVWERDDFHCRYCGARQFLSIDHKVPESAGGTLDLDNLLTACMPCNRTKGTKNYEDFVNQNALDATFELLMEAAFNPESMLRKPDTETPYSTDRGELVVVPFDEFESEEHYVAGIIE